MTDRRTTGAGLTSREIKGAVAAALVDVGAPASLLNPRDAGWYKSNGATWDMKTDSSCGWELASRALTLNDHGHNEELERVCHHVGRLNPDVNDRCGLHMHIQARDLSWAQLQNLVWLWTRYEPFWFSLVPIQRRLRHYCHPICSSDYSGNAVSSWGTAKRLITGRRDDANVDRWPRASLNLRPWWSSGRVEVRLHHGSISYDEMREWAMLMLALVERAKNTPTVEPYEPRARSRPYSTEYIAGLLLLDHPNTHNAAADLLRRIEARRLLHNPQAPLPFRLDGTDALSRIRTLAEQPAPPRRRQTRTRTRTVAEQIIDEPLAGTEAIRQQLLSESQRTRRGRRRT